MTDHPRDRPGTDNIETPDPDPNRRPGPDEESLSETFPEQPAGSGTQGGLMQGDRSDFDAVTGDAGAPEANPATSNQPERSEP